MPAPTQNPIGRLARAAFIFSSAGVYGTEQIVNGANGHLIPAESLQMGQTKAESKFPHGAMLKNEVVEVLTDVKGEATIKVPFRYDGAGPALLAALIGTDTVSTVDVSAKKHVLAWVDSAVNIGTIALWFGNTNGTVQVLRSCKIASAVIDVKSNAPASITVKVIGDEVILNSSTNTAAVLGGMTLATDPIKKLMMYWHATTRATKNAGFIRIKQVTGAEGNCATADTIYPSSWKLSIDRKLKQGDSPDQFQLEPVEDGPPEFKFDVDVAGFEGNAGDKQGAFNGFVQALQTQQGTSALVYKADFYFESPDLAGSTTQKYGTRILCPEVGVIIKNPGLSGMGLIGAKLEGRCMQAQAAPNGTDWAAITDPLNLTIWNQRATTYI